jgi:hypothetical protein
MNKIEFLSASLPYGLKCTVDKPYDYKIIGLNLGHSPFITIHGEFTGSLYCEKFDKCIPIIRHPDTLTQECVQADYNDGKAFIPILELAKKACPGWDWIIYNNNECCSDSIEFCYHGGSFLCTEKPDMINYVVYNQLQLFQILLKFHFWPNKPEGEEVVYVTNEFNPYK